MLKPMPQQQLHRSRSIEKLSSQLGEFKESVDRRLREVIRRQLANDLKLGAIMKKQDLVLDKIDKVLLKASGYDVEIAALNRGMQRIEKTVFKDG